MLDKFDPEKTNFQNPPTELLISEIDDLDFPNPSYIPPLERAFSADDWNLEDKGFKPIESEQIRKFLEYFDFFPCAIWLNEPIAPRQLYEAELSAKELQMITHGGFMRPDIIIFKPPNNIYIVEFTHKLTARTLGQILHYVWLYARYNPGVYNINGIAVFDILTQSIIEHLIQNEIIPIYQLKHLEEGEFTPDFCICFSQNGQIDLSYLENTFFKTFNNHLPNYSKENLTGVE